MSVFPREAANFRPEYEHELTRALFPVAFDTFDPAKTGSIGEKEFKRLISVVNDGKPIYPGNFKNALAEFDR